MRLGGATGASPASRSGHHDRSQPVPPLPCACATGSGGGSGSRSGIQPAHRWRDLDTPSQFQRPRRSQRARLTPVTPAASARSTSNVPPLRDHERPPRNQRQQDHERPQSRYVRARLRCSSRASPPLTPRAGTPAATIGMRPATALRTKTKSVNGLLRAVGSRGFSYASSAARVPTALKKLSQEKV